MNQNNGDETQSLQRLKRLSDSLIDYTPEKKQSLKIGIESIIEPLVSLFSIVVSLVKPSYWEWSCFLIFPLYLIL